ncbi:hypothetical protein DM2_2761 [Halorubrum sp. DM2]|nr:hypothetical protein DM2_2761 [Halorubrum sp. DM2]
MSEGWDWKLTDRSKRQLDALDEYARDRIIFCSLCSVEILRM